MFTATKPCDSTLQTALLLLPTATVLVALPYCPTLETFRLSLYKTLFLRQRQAWARPGGLVTLLTSGICQYSFSITAALTAAVVLGTLDVSLLIGYLILFVDVWSSVYLVTAIWPYALPPAVAAIFPSLILHPNLDILTHYLGPLAPPTLDQFNDGPQAFATLAIVTVWRQLGYNTTFIVAALNGIPEILMENACIDGVGRFGMLYKVYVPMIMPAMMFLAIMNTVYTLFSMSPLVDLMTSDGSSDATDFLIFKLYRDVFQLNSLGLASAQSVTLFVIVSVLMYIQLRFASGYGRYGR